MARTLALAFGALGACGCNALWGIDELAPATSSASSSVAIASAASSSTGGTSSTSSGSGGMVTALDDTELVVRYFLDDALESPFPLIVADAAPDPIDLPLTYALEMSFVEVDGHHGLSWRSSSSPGRASIAIDQTKIALLDGSTRGTIEVVVDFTGDSGQDFARFVHIGEAANFGRFSFGATTLLNAAIVCIEPDAVAGGWQLPSVGRAVLHAVVDTTQANAAERVRLYHDGVRVTDTLGAPIVEAPAQGQKLTFDAGSYLVLGNREVGDRGFEGTLYYAAIYSAALDEAAVAHNAALLLGSDDG